MKRAIIFLLSILLAQVSAWAAYTYDYTFAEDGILYKVTSTNPYEVAVVGYGTAWDTYPDDTDVVIPETVNYEGNDYTVTSIAYSAFGWTNITSVVIPGTVVSIEGSAFAYCSSLTEVTIGYGVESIGDYAFQYCSSLKQLVFPDSVKTIGDKICYYCSILEMIVFGSGVESFGQFEFEGCCYLTTIIIKSEIAPSLYVDGNTDDLTFKEYCDGTNYPFKIYVPAGTDEEGNPVYANGYEVEHPWKTLLGTCGDSIGNYDGEIPDTSDPDEEKCPEAYYDKDLEKIITVCDDEYNELLDPDSEDHCEKIKSVEHTTVESKNVTIVVCCDTENPRYYEPLFDDENRTFSYGKAVYECDDVYNPKADPNSGETCSNDYTKGPLGRYVDPTTGITMTTCDDGYNPCLDPFTDLYCPSDPQVRYTDPLTEEKMTSCKKNYNPHLDSKTDSYCGCYWFTEEGKKHLYIETKEAIGDYTMTPCDEGYCDPVPKYTVVVDGVEVPVYECDEAYNPKADPENEGNDDDNTTYCGSIDDTHPIYIDKVTGETMTPCDEGYCNPLPKYTVVVDGVEVPVYECTPEYNPKADPDNEEYCNTDEDGNELENSGTRYVDPESGKAVTVCDEGYDPHFDPKADEYCEKDPYPRYQDPITGEWVYICDEDYVSALDPENNDSYCAQVKGYIVKCSGSCEAEIYVGVKDVEDLKEDNDGCTYTIVDVVCCDPIYKYIDPNGNLVYECDDIYNPKADPNSDEYCTTTTDDSENEVKLVPPGGRYVDSDTGITMTVCDDGYDKEKDPLSDCTDNTVRYTDPLREEGENEITICNLYYNPYLDYTGECGSVELNAFEQGTSPFECATDEYKSCTYKDENGEEKLYCFKDRPRYIDPETGKTVTICEDNYNPYLDPESGVFCGKEGNSSEPDIRYWDPFTETSVTVCDDDYNPHMDPSSEFYCDPTKNGYPVGRYRDEYLNKTITVCDDEYNKYADPNSGEYCESGGEPVIRYHEPETGRAVTVCDENYNPKADPENENNDKDDEKYCEDGGRYTDETGKVITKCDDEYNPYADPDSDEYCEPEEGSDKPVIRYTDPETGKVVTVCDEDIYNPHADPNSDEYCEPTDGKPVIRYVDPETGKVVTVCDEDIYNPHADPNNDGEDGDDKYCNTDENGNTIEPVIRYVDPETGKAITMCDDEYNEYADPNSELYCNKDEYGNEIEPVIRYTDPETGKVVTMCDDEYNPHADPNNEDEYCTPTDVDDEGNLIPAIRYTDPVTGAVVTICDDNYNPSLDPNDKENYCEEEGEYYIDEETGITMTPCDEGYCPDPSVAYQDPITGEDVTKCDDNYNPYLDPGSGVYCNEIGEAYIDPNTGKTLTPCDDGYCFDHEIRYQDPVTGRYILRCDEDYSEEDEDKYKDGWEKDLPDDCYFAYYDPFKGKIIYTCDDDYNPRMDPSSGEYCDPDKYGYEGSVARYEDPITGKTVTVCDDEYNPYLDPESDEYNECDVAPEDRTAYVDPVTGKTVTPCDDEYNPYLDPNDEENYCDPEVYGEPLLRYTDPITGKEITICDDDYNPYLDPSSDAYCDQYGEPVGRYPDPTTGWTMTACDEGYDPSLDPYVDNDDDDGGVKKDGDEEADPKEDEEATEQEPDDPSEKLDDEHKTVLDTDTEEPGVEEIIPDEVIIRAEDTSIYVSTPTLTRVTVNDLSGVMLISEMVEGTAKLEVGSRGLFIVKVGHVIEKVLLK